MGYTCPNNFIFNRGGKKTFINELLNTNIKELIRDYGLVVDCWGCQAPPSPPALLAVLDIQKFRLSTKCKSSICICRMEWGTTNKLNYPLPNITTFTYNSHQIFNQLILLKSSHGRRIIILFRSRITFLSKRGGQPLRRMVAITMAGNKRRSSMVFKKKKNRVAPAGSDHRASGTVTTCPVKLG